MNSIGKNIKRLRTDSNMTQDALGERLHVTRQTVSNWETEKNQPDIETLEALAAVFCTDINEIIYGNKRNEYPRLQRRYVLSAALCLTAALLSAAVMAILLPRLREISRQTYTLVLETALISELSPALLHAALGFGIPSVFALWFDCSVKRNRLCGIFAALALTPVLLMAAEYIAWTFISENVPMYVLRGAALMPWLRALLLKPLPFAAGVLLFLYFNPKTAKEAP